MEMLWKFYHLPKGWWRFYTHESGAVSVVRAAMELRCRKLSRDPLKCVCWSEISVQIARRQRLLQHLSKSALIIQGENCQQHALKIISRNINCQPSRIITPPATIIKTFSPAAEFIFSVRFLANSSHVFSMILIKSFTMSDRKHLAPGKHIIKPAATR